MAVSEKICRKNLLIFEVRTDPNCGECSLWSSKVLIFNFRIICAEGSWGIMADVKASDFKQSQHMKWSKVKLWSEPELNPKVNPSEPWSEPEVNHLSIFRKLLIMLYINKSYCDFTNNTFLVSSQCIVRAHVLENFLRYRKPYKILFMHISKTFKVPDRVLLILLIPITGL